MLPRRVGRAGFLFRRKHPDIARFRWIRRLPWPLRVVVASRPFRRIADFAQSVGDLQPMGCYYYLRNSEAFWEGFREAARETEISSNGPHATPKPVTEKTATAVTSTEQGTVEPTPAQRAELDRRLEAYRTAPNEGAPWDDVKDRLGDCGERPS